MIKKLLIKLINILFPSFFKRRHQKKIENEFFIKHKVLKEKNKIIYALTPPPRLSNIGDHAQVVAIYQWFKDFFPDLPVIELNKDECISMIKPLKELVHHNDIIFLHSGGNMGDRGMWSETGRRNIIESFPENRIISLPQTIFFSDTVNGRKEKEKTISIYNKHKNLTIIGRDMESTELAANMFPGCKIFALPDFVLYINPRDFITENNQKTKGALLCLRQDNESALSDNKIDQLIKTLGMSFELFDTTIKTPIDKEERINYLKDTLNFFNKFDIVVTDRYHGLIFASLLNKPTIVLPTIDHKLTSAIKWFSELSYIQLIEMDQIEELDILARNLIKTPKGEGVDWKKLHFNGLKEKLYEKTN